MTIGRFNLVPMLSKNYSLCFKTVNPDNPNYRNDYVSANYRNNVPANAATAITSKQYFPIALTASLV
jgi:hypothetical protein